MGRILSFLFSSWNEGRALSQEDVACVCNEGVPSLSVVLLSCTWSFCSECGFLLPLLVHGVSSTFFAFFVVSLPPPVLAFANGVFSPQFCLVNGVDLAVLHVHDVSLPFLSVNGVSPPLSLVGGASPQGISSVTKLSSHNGHLGLGWECAYDFFPTLASCRMRVRLLDHARDMFGLFMDSPFAVLPMVCYREAMELEGRGSHSLRARVPEQAFSVGFSRSTSVPPVTTPKPTPKSRQLKEEGLCVLSSQQATQELQPWLANTLKMQFPPRGSFFFLCVYIYMCIFEDMYICICVF